MDGDCDVLILGAGLGGCATALALLRVGPCRVVLADRPRQAPFRIGESATPDVPRLLQRLGLDGDLGNQGHRPCHGTLSLWGGRREFDDFLRRGQGHGWHLDRAAFDAHLSRQAVAAGARLLERSGLEAILRTTEGWQVKLTDRTPINARVVVDAAGRGSPLATRLGANRHRLDKLVALAAIATPDADGGLVGQSMVEPTEHGWWYAAPLPDGRAIVTLMTDADMVHELGLGDSAAFHRAWAATDELRRLVPPPTQPVPPALFAAHSSFIDRAAGPGWLAVGDALIGFDPLTSSGMAGALDDALAAADTIVAWLSGTPPTEPGQAYGRRADSTVRRYLADRSRIYGLERRWPNSRFWQRRQGADPARM